MSRTFIRQDTQVRQSDVFDGGLTPGSTLQSGSASLEGDLNSLRSQVYNLLKKQAGGAWYDALSAPSQFPGEGNTTRAVDNLNSDLHVLERKRVLVAAANITDVTVPAAASATATFSSSGAFSDGETLTIGAQTYTFKTPFVNAANNIDASGTVAQTHENLRRAINGQGVAGTNYGTGTVTNANVSATDTATSNVLTALTGGTWANNIATSDSCTNATIGASLTGGAGDVVVLLIGELPAQTIAAIGAVTTIGTVGATNATFGNHALTAVAGANALAPKNLCEVEDEATHDPILSSGRIIYALFHNESATDGSTMTGTTTNRAQLTFVRINSGGTALERVPTADIAGKVIHYTSVQRKALEDLNEQDFLKGAVTDTPAAVSVTRQGAYDGQGATAVEVVTNSTLDLNTAGVFWELRDLVNATLLRLTEGSTGGTTTLQVGADVDTFDVNALVNDFAAGLKVRTGSQEIKIGVTDGVIESTATNNLRISAAGGVLQLDDSYQTASTWVGTTGVPLANSSAEWSTYRTNYGEVSLLNAINQAITAGITRSTKVFANVTTDAVADTNVGGTSGGANLDAQLQDLSIGSFIDDNDVFLNGSLLRGGADAAANNDYYPGTSLATGQLKFEFKLKTGDVLSLISWR
jgi:hypothetical protein